MLHCAATGVDVWYVDLGVALDIRDCIDAFFDSLVLRPHEGPTPLNWVLMKLHQQRPRFARLKDGSQRCFRGTPHAACTIGLHAVTTLHMTKGYFVYLDKKHCGEAFAW